jgi:hypothetical protein
MDKLAIITTTYRNDLDCCKILCESIDRFVPSDIMHYLFVEDRDVALFRFLGNERRKVYSQNLIKPWWLLRIPFKIKGHNFWMSPFTLPVRGWIMQQVIKLGVFEVLDEQVFLCLDSEAFFVKPFNPSVLFKNEKVMMVRHEEYWDWPNTVKYNDSAKKLLKLPEHIILNNRYMSVQFIFRKDILMKLSTLLKKNSVFRSWKIPLFNRVRLSEYTLYGVFVDEVLGIENTLHYPGQEFLIKYIGPKSYGHDLSRLEEFLDKYVIEKNEVGMLLQKGRTIKKGISPSANEYYEIVKRLWNRINN